MREVTLKSLNQISVFRNCGVVMAKSKFERLSGVGVWLANPSSELCQFSGLQS